MKRGLLKKVLSCTVAILLTLGLGGCFEKKQNQALNSIKEKKKIVIGLNPDYAPFDFKDKQGNIVGMDVEIAKEIAKDLGVEYEIKSMAFRGLIGALNEGKIDIIISGMNPTPEREKNVLFSDGYYDSVSQLVVKKGEASKYKDIKDIEGKKISVQRGTVQETQATDAKAGEVKGLDAATDCILTLKAGKVDGVLLDKPVAMLTIKSNDDIELSDILIKDTETKPFAIAMKKGETDLQTEINKTLEKLKSEGKLDKFFKEAVEKAQE